MNQYNSSDLSLVYFSLSEQLGYEVSVEAFHLPILLCCPKYVKIP